MRLFDRYYRKGDPKAMAVGSPFPAPRVLLAEFPSAPALRTNSARFQRRSIVYTNLRQPARFLHLERACAGGSWRTGWRRNVSRLVSSPPPNPVSECLFLVQLGVVTGSRSASAKERARTLEPVRRDSANCRTGSTDYHGRLSESRHRDAGLSPACLCSSRASPSRFPSLALP